MPESVDRRRFLLGGLGGAVALGATLAGCGTDPTGVDRPPGRVPGGGTTSVPDNGALASLRSQLTGPLVLPGDPDYPSARLVFNPRFDDIAPAAVAFCASPADVSTSIRFARETGTPLAARNGGHSYAGYSLTPGLVVDVSSLSDVSLDARGEVATVGAGARLIHVYTRLDERGVTVPGGSCPTVGITGLTLGGGFGLIARRHGLTCDSLTGLDIVTADGELRHCDERADADLYWACRGGGGGNFGIVTALTFAAVPVSEVSYYTYTWPWARAAAVFDAWQRSAPVAPDGLFSECKLQSVKDPAVGGMQGLAVVSTGQYLGPADELRELLAPLVAAGGAPATTELETVPYLAAVRYFAGCPGQTESQCRLGGPSPGQEPDGEVPRQSYKAKSQFFEGVLDGAGIEVMTRWLERFQSDPATAGTGLIQADSMGGAINRRPPDATAYVHRGSSFHCQFITIGPANGARAVTGSQLGWIAAFYDELRPSSNGHAYQNYIDPDLPDWAGAYYGGNLDRLVDIKTAVDPDDLFHFAQSIPTRR
jgi:FAD/FMN-containing dehydrogenase